ncbi:hypothetical protein EDB84DRAFT_1445885 [Lactarius hengduanensis]|nr:hypothetical protein EDB84DRAFT_1445885 [Lactarius hengduanensis]
MCGASLALAELSAMRLCLLRAVQLGLVHMLGNVIARVLRAALRSSALLEDVDFGVKARLLRALLRVRVGCLSPCGKARESARAWRGCTKPLREMRRCYDYPKTTIIFVILA